MIYLLTPHIRDKNPAKNGIITSLLRPLFKFIRFLKYPNKWCFPHLLQFVRRISSNWQYIHVHFTASDPLEKSWGRKLEVAQFSPDQEPLGRNTGISILEHITTV